MDIRVRSRKLVRNAGYSYTGFHGLDECLQSRLALLLGPMAPHLCEELWERFGSETSIFSSRLPEADARYIASETYTLVLQVNGKIRARIEVEKDAPRERLEEIALADERIKKHLEGARLVKAIVVPGRLVNLVVKSG